MKLTVGSCASIWGTGRIGIFGRQRGSEAITLEAAAPSGWQ
jgi:hypothetical protein